MASSYDVIVLGGAFSGAATALLLKRESPGLRVAVIERSQRFDRKVGEATTEVSGAFLTKRLGLTHHLSHQHIVKHGLRFWFSRDADQSLEDCPEVGSTFQVRLPTYQVDREVLDTHLLELARAEGVEVIRPARVKSWKREEGMSELQVLPESGEAFTATCRWLVDCSGRASFVARELGHHRRLEEHPTNALWARFRGVKDWDGDELRRKFPRYAARVQVSRASATNHLTGYGWWVWIIPLKGGDYSIGLVYDTRLYSPPEGATPGEKLKKHLLTHAVGREMLAGAEIVPGDVKAYGHLPYYTTQLAGPGWQIAGDAAGFIDPLYSQGLDFCAWTVTKAVNRILDEEAGREVCLDGINLEYTTCYQTWFKALYLDKYKYLGDAPLMTAAFLMDIGTFFFGPVRELTQCLKAGFDTMPFNGPGDKLAGRIMGYYNWRLGCIADHKRRYGCYGAENVGPGLLVKKGFAPNPGVIFLVLDGAALWLKEEIKMAGRLLFRRKSVPLAQAAEQGLMPLPEALPAAER